MKRRKICVKCKKSKAIEYFNIDRSRPDGRYHTCKECRKASYDPAAFGRYYRTHRKRYAKSRAKWRAENKKYLLEYTRAYRAAHPGLNASIQGKRKACQKAATPPWANKAAIQAIYAEAARLTKETGILHHVDHKIPLQGRLVSGLHVEGNLQIMIGSANSSKYNKFEPIIEFFETSEKSRDAA